MQNETQLRSELVTIGRRLYEKNMIAAYDGNISVRCGNNCILTTPSGISKGFLNEDDLIVITSDGEKISGNGKPSSEIKMHLKVYQLRPDVHAVVHAHPPYCTALTLAGIPMDTPIIPEVVISLGSIPTAPYATPSTEEVPDSIAPFIRNHDAILLERHGSLTVGDTLSSAYFKQEKLEHTAHILHTAILAGTIKPIPDKQVAKLLEIRKKLFNR